eukprot:scaffold294_cov36-Attheya_sp.AAC.1
MAMDGDEETREVVAESEAPLHVDYDADVQYGNEDDASEEAEAPLHVDYDADVQYGNEDASEEAVDDESELYSSDATVPVENGDRVDEHIVEYQDPTADIDNVAREREIQHDEGYDPDTLPTSTEGEEEEGFTEEEEEQMAKDEAMIDSSMLHYATSTKESNEREGDDEDTVQMDMDEKEVEDTILVHQSLNEEILHERVANTEDEVDGTSSGQEASDNQSSEGSVTSDYSAKSGNSDEQADEESKEDNEEQKDILMEPEEKAGAFKDDVLTSDALPSAISLQHDVADENKQTDVEQNVENEDEEGNKQADEERKEDDEEQKDILMDLEEKAADTKDDLLASDALPSAISLERDVMDENNHMDVEQSAENEEEEGSKHATEDSKEENEEQKDILMEPEEKAADIQDDVLASDALPSSISLQHDVMNENMQSDVEQKVENEEEREEGTIHVSTAATAPTMGVSDAVSLA